MTNEGKKPTASKEELSEKWLYRHFLRDFRHVAEKRFCVLDIAFRGGDVVDGSGAPRQRADIGVRNGRVVAIGALDEPARRVIDADGLVIAPGFIDPHTHFDAAVSWDPFLTPSPLLGVTTVLAGNCGFTLAPLTADSSDYIMRMLSMVEGMPLEALAGGCDWSPRSFEEFIARLDGQLAINAGFSVGHSTLRRIVMGAAAIGERASDEQIERMTLLAHRALAAGALGFTTSLGDAHVDGDGQPVPSRHAHPDEFVRLAATVRDHIGTSLGITPPIGPFSDATKQLLTDMSIAGDRPISWNVMLVEAKHTDVYEGQIVGGDYAHARGGSVIALTVPELSRLRLSFDNGMILNMVPEWGDVLALPLRERKAALADPGVRQRMFDGYSRMPNNSVRTRLDWPLVQLGTTYAPSTQRFANRRLADIAAEQHCDPLEALLDIAVADDLRTDIWPPAPGDDDESWRLREQVWRDPRVVFGGGDAGAHLDMSQSWRYFMTLLGEHVREHQRLSLEEAVHLITLRPARLFGLRDRGRIGLDSVADLTIFDPARVGSGALSMRTDLPGGAARIWSHGIGLAHVFVGGVEVVHDDELTGAKGGTILRSGRDTTTVTPRDFPSGS